MTMKNLVTSRSINLLAEIKICKGCKESLPIDNFAKCDGHGNRRSLCKPCYTEDRHRKKGTWEKYQKEQAYRQELHILQEKGQRRCRMCSTIKVLDEFPNDYKPSVFYNKKTYCKKCAHETWRIPARKTEHFKKLKAGYDKKYRANNKEKINAWNYKKYHTDVQHKLKHNLRNRLNKSLKLKNTTKSLKTVELLGCSIDDFKIYLENKFQDGMSWDNHAQYGWHIDHIIPLDAFDLTKPEEQLKACHYTNLQPLWWKENLQKNNKIGLDKGSKMSYNVSIVKKEDTEKMD